RTARVASSLAPASGLRSGRPFGGAVTDEAPGSRLRASEREEKREERRDTQTPGRELREAARRWPRSPLEPGAWSLEPLSQLLLDLFDLERLEDVLLLDVVEALEADAALEALGDLLDVVLEALERVDLALPDRHA